MDCLPLHVLRAVSATCTQGHNMINHIARTLPEMLPVNGQRLDDRLALAVAVIECRGLQRGASGGIGAISDRENSSVG